ncbi:MAG TPA: dihydrodipicolinate synthase family protein [Candidatus Limnocylindria bacterium]|nr:dihydrodipicolinate synthase family protein [Candidatus Limnocylindria bacterium]
MVEQIRGIVLPSPTVFREDGKVDEPLMRELTDWFVACGVHAFFILGSYGQGAAMHPEERKNVAEMVVQQVKHRVPVVVHIGAVDPYTAIDLGKHAKAIGAEAVGHVGPYYYADRSEFEIIEHLKMVDRAVGMPMLIYNNPRYSGYNIQPNFMARLVEAVPNIFGAKLAMGSVDEAMAYMKIVKAPFAPYALASNLVAAMSVGVAGTISPPLAVTPEIGVELVRAIDAGDATRAFLLQKNVIRIHDIFLRLAGPFGRTIYREAMRLRGFDVKMYPRWPSKPLSREAYDEMRDLFTELNLIGAAGQLRSA